MSTIKLGIVVIPGMWSEANLSKTQDPIKKDKKKLKREKKKKKKTEDDDEEILQDPT
jgi:hypothetical protein